jgi:E3 ubiquitin-protein ligase BRE1
MVTAMHEYRLRGSNPRPPDDIWAPLACYSSVSRSVTITTERRSDFCKQISNYNEGPDSICSEIYSIKRHFDSESTTRKLNVAERQEKFDVVSKELERVQQKLRDAYREQDRLNSKIREVSRDLDRGSRAMKRESRLDDALMKLEADSKRLRSERNEAQDRLRQLQSMQPSETTQELFNQMKGMESEIKMLKSSISSHEKMVGNVTEIENFKSSYRADVSDYQARLAGIQMLLDSAIGRLNSWIHKHVEQLKLNEELRWLLEISHGCLGVENKLDEKDVCDVIQKFLKSELPGLEDRIRQSSESVILNREENLMKKMTELQQQLEGAKGHQASISADLKKSQQDNAALREEAEVFWKEMDSVSDAYESSREQNARLLLSMSKRDEENARLLSEAAAAARSKAIMEEERDQAKDRVQILERDFQELNQTVSELEDRLEKVSKERDAFKFDALHLKEKVENLSTEIKTLGISMDSLRSELSSTKKEINAVEEDKAKHLAALKMEKTRAERAEAMLSGKKDAKLQAGETAEREALRKMVNCNVCSTRLKDRIITKCSHLFCSTCIDANLSSRHRKCPGCGERFGAGDVKPFYFT